MPDIKFFELAAQILPTLMIAIVIEVRTCASVLFPNGLDLNRPAREVISSLSEVQSWAIIAWIGTSITFATGELIALATVYWGAPNAVLGYMVVTALMELTGFAALIPAAQFLAGLKTKAP